MRTLLYDEWKFCPAETKEPDFSKIENEDWRPVQLPHDWSCDYPVEEHADTCGSGGYARAGIGWYRRTFSVEKEEQERVLLYFEGVYMNSTVYVNGKKAGGHIYGYTPFEIDITEAVRDGGNEILVVVDNSKQPGSRWYSGSGITRDVWLETRKTLHIARYGTYFTTELQKDTAELHLEIVLHEEEKITEELRKELRLQYVLKNPDGEEVVCAEQPVPEDWQSGSYDDLIMDGKDTKEHFTLWTNTVRTVLPVTEPKLWNVEKPVLYCLEICLWAGERCLETRTEHIGIRETAFSSEKGFLLNGRQLKLNGVCLHHDGGCVGAAVPKEIWERRLKKLKDMGVNAIRCAHNPPDTAVLELCDRLGLTVMDEAFDEWNYGKAKETGTNTHESYGYSAYFKECHEWDLKTMIYRDRNHPSVILWSIGNEVPDQVAEGGEFTVKELKEICHKADPSRCITQGNDQIMAEPASARQEFLEELDVVGYNYVGRWRTRAELFYDEDHQKYPHRCLIGTENPSAGYAGGNYKLTYDSDFPWEKPYYSAPVAVGKLLRYTMTHDFVAGDYMWTGIDYLGEADWPKKSTGCGCLDTCGFEKDAFYFYKSVWNRKEPFAYLCPHWNLPLEQGTILPMICYTSCADAELFVNGRSYGKKSKGFPCYGMTEQYGHFETNGSPANTDDLFLTWDVPYEPGRVEVVGYEQKQEVCRYVMETAGAPYAIRLEPDTSTIRADDRSVVQIGISILDREGRLVPTADCELELSLKGDGKVLGIDNGYACCHIPWKELRRKAFNGKMFAVIQAGKQEGSLTVSVTGKGLVSAETEIIMKN